MVLFSSYHFHQGTLNGAFINTMPVEVTFLPVETHLRVKLNTLMQLFVVHIHSWNLSVSQS